MVWAPGYRTRRPTPPQDWVQGDTQFTGLDFTNAGEEWTDNSQLSNGLDPTRVVSLDPDESTQVEITESIAADTGAGPVKVTLAGPSLDAFLNARLASSDAPGLATFLLAINASNQGWGIASREHADLSLRPVLAIPDTSVLPGDYNGDTVVDARDYAVWRQAYSNAPGGPEAVHLNSAGDGLAGVDTGDYHHWLANYGATQTPSTPTPEPGALVLAALSCLGLSARRRRE